MADFDFENELMRFKEQIGLDDLQIVSKEEQFNAIDFISSLNGGSSLESSKNVPSGERMSIKDQFSRMLNDNLDMSVVRRQNSIFGEVTEEKDIQILQ